MSRLPAAVGFGLAVILGVVSARADDGWNPFKSREDEPRRERTAPARQSASPDGRPPLLAPMDGVGTKPWLGNDAREASSPAGYADSRYRTDRDAQPEPWSSGPPSYDQRPPAQESVQRTELQPLPPVASPSPAPVASSSPLTHPTGWNTRTEPTEPSVSWQSLDAATLSELVAPLTLPPRSAPLAKLWHQVITGPKTRASSGDAKQAAAFDAMRMNALYRSGYVDELRKATAAVRPAPDDPVAVLSVARSQIVLGDRQPGCISVKGVQRAQSSLPKSAREDFLLLAALCGVGDGDASKARIAADLLRSEGVPDSVALASLEALASGKRGAFDAPTTKKLSPLDYRFLELVDAEPSLAGAEPALLAIIANSQKASPTRILAAESALVVHAIDGAALAEAYRSMRFSASALAQPFAEDQPPPLQRALLFQAFEAEKAPIKMARFARALLDEVRRADGPYQQVASLLAPSVAELRPSPELGWFAETAIEIGLAGHRIDTVREWVSAQSGAKPGHFEDWLALADIATSDWHGRRGEALHAVERRGVNGELAPELMHRLVTVLDALDYQIPIPLWDAASRTQQPTSGFLPETGVLSELQNASRQREQERVVLLAMRTLGPESGATAHMIALGDTIRALKTAGLEAEARQLGLEALYMTWPRSRVE